jgi:hypothetical protein
MSKTAAVSVPVSLAFALHGCRALAIFWLETVVSTIGSWMNDFGARRLGLGTFTSSTAPKYTIW